MKQNHMRLLRMLVAIVGVVVVSSGCAPMMFHEAGLQGSSTQYSTLKPSLPPPAQGMGRLFVYLTAGGPSASWAIGIGPAMNGFLTIDDAVYAYLGGSYFYVDLPAGPHVVTSGEAAFEASEVRRGQNVIDINLAGGDASYVRIDLTGIGVGTIAAPVLVDSKTAEQEIAPLRMAKESKTRYTVTH